jgi:hypothetical protein
VGDEAGTAITTGDYNTAVGYEALALTATTGSHKIRLVLAGYKHLQSSITACISTHVAVGTSAFRSVHIRQVL